MIEPPPASRMWAIAYLQHRYTDVRLTRCTRSHASRPVSRIESSSGGEMPALLKATWTRPYSATARSNRACTWGSSATSTWRKRPPTSAAAFSPASTSTSTHTTCAPSAAKRRAVARPMPLPAPVTTAFLPSRRPGTVLLLRRDEDVLGLGERERRVRTEFPAQPGRLEAAERRPVPHRGVRVDREVAGVDGARDADRPADVPRPDRAGEAELAVVGDADGVGLVVERDDGDDRPEDLLVQRPILRIGRRQDRRREPVAGAGRRRTAERDRGVVGDVFRDSRPLAGADQRPHLGLLVGRIGDDDLLHGR